MCFKRLRYYAAIFLCYGFLQACDLSQPSVSIVPLAANAVILAYGDSLTYGTGAGAGKSYPDVLSALINRKVINAGVPGETSVQGLARLAATLDEAKPDLLILIHGGNDYLRRQPESALKENLSQMITIASARSIPVVLMSVPKPAIFLKPAKVYRELAEQYQLPLDDVTLSEILADRALKSDQVHPNAAGYRRIAEKLQALLVASGAL